jgi:hypothetical protein
MIQWSKSKGYEVSSVGDWRFSALYAKLYDGRSIEAWYQCCVKGYDPLGTNWKLGKGKPPLRPMSSDQLYREYKALWQQWADGNPDLIDELFEACKSFDYHLRDSFANTPVNQARALADILNSIYFKEST